MSGGSAPDETRPRAQADQAKAKPLDRAEVAAAIAELRWYTALQLEGVQAMLDGVTLGAEQVQDKRIELLEKGPEVDLGAEILLFAVILLLESPAAGIFIGALLAPVARGIAKAVTKRLARQAGQLAEDIRLFTEAAAEAGAGSTKLTRMERHSRKQRRKWKEIAKDLEGVAKLLEQDLRGKATSIKQVSDTLAVVTNQVPAYMVAGIKGAREVANSHNVPPRPLPESSPGVSVRAAAMAAAARLRLTVKAAHETLEAELWKEGLTAAEAREIIAVQRVSASLDLAELTLSHQVMTEAMIWARLLITAELSRNALNRPDRARRRVRDQQSRFTPSAGTPDPTPQPPLERESFDDYLTLSDTRLAEYLIARFSEQIAQWASDTNAFLPYLEAPGGWMAELHPRPDIPFEQLFPQDKQDLLVQYLVSINERTPPDFVLR